VTIVSIYIFSSWWDWGYGGCFGARAFCQQLAFLSIPLAFFIDFVFYSSKKYLFRGLVRLAALLVISSCLCLNLGQSYQYQSGLIHPDAMTKKAYWNLFRKYHYPDKYFENELMPYLDFVAKEKWKKGEGRDDKQTPRK